LAERPVLGIDLGKIIRSAAGMSADGHGVFRRRVSRDGILVPLSKLPPCAAAMNRAWDAWVDRDHPPARATIEGKLVNPAWTVEIIVTAALPG
jgi:enamine deaminase RidA (YjgF/YER057c/UK114 family)